MKNVIASMSLNSLETSSPITDHRALLVILKENSSKKAITVVYHDGSIDFYPINKIENLPGAKTGLVDYISRRPYQPAKRISKYDEEFLFATLSRIHTDAKLLHQEKTISAVTLYKLYHDDKSNLQKSSTQYRKTVLKINFANSKLVIKDNMSPVLQSSISKLPLKHNTNFISDSSTRVHLTHLLPSNTINSDSAYAMRVRLTKNNSILPKQKPNQNSNHINCTKFDSTLVPQVHITQNQLAFSLDFHTLKSNTLNQNNSDCDFDREYALLIIN